MIGQNVMNQTLLQNIKEKLDAGLFPQWLLTDPDIYKLEMDQIFGRTWQYLGHESELQEPGSYITRWMVDDPILLTRNNNGEIKAFLNSCAHRGVHLCTAASGKKKAFTCPYHGWTYNLDGELIGVVAGEKLFSSVMDKKDWALRPVPRVEIYKGLIFGNLDPNAKPLEEFLGEFKFYLDIILGRSDGGMEVRGVPQRWVVHANWKMVAENFVDPYHVQTSHRSTVELGMSGAAPTDAMYASHGHGVSCENGHGICVIVRKNGELKYQGLPESMWEMIERNLTPEQLEVYKNVSTLVGTVFPNLSFNCPMHGNEGVQYNYFNLRVWRPLGPEKVEVISWFMIDKEAPEEYKEHSYKGYVGSFGPSGTLEQDDTEIWARVVAASKGKMSRDKELNYNNYTNYLMGMDLVTPDENFAGPGVAYPTNYVDFMTRNYHDHWFQLLTSNEALKTEKR